MATDDLLIRVDAQTSQFDAKFGAMTSETLRFEAALKRASAQQALLEDQVKKYGATSTQAQAALTRAQTANARLAEQQAAAAAKAAAAQKAALESQLAAQQRLGRGMVATGGAIALGLGLATKAAIDWESAFAGVRKVIDGTPEQIAAVETGLRELATTLPTSAEELAAIAASAGALGIATPNVVEFTATIAKLGETTNLVGEEGAATLARFANIMGTSQTEIDNVASALVALGNNGASTESEIAAMGLRIAAAGDQAGLTEGEVLGLANAASSLGVQAESGGTAISRTFQQIGTAVKGGGDKLEAFADVAGVSVAQFKRQFEQDAAGAFTTFLKGLDAVNQSGGDVAGTLATLGITSARQIDTLSRLAGRTDLLAESLEQGNDAYASNSALQSEFDKRLDTTAAQLEIARNEAHDFAISLGETLLPAVGNVAGGLGDLVGALNDIPGPFKQVVGLAALTVAGFALIGGGSLLLRTKLAQLKLTMAEVGVQSALMNRTMLRNRAVLGGLGVGLEVLNSRLDDSQATLKGFVSLGAGLATGFAVGGPVGAAIGGTASLLGQLGQQTDIASQFQAQFAQVAQTVVGALDQETGAITEATRAAAINALATQGVYTEFAKLGVASSDVTDAALGNADAYKVLEDALDSTFGGSPFADDIREGLLVPIDQTTGAIDAFREGLSETEAQMGGATSNVEAFGRAAEQTAGRVETLTDALKALQGLLDQRAAIRNYEAALDKVNDLADKNIDITRENTTEQRDAQAAFDDIAASAIVVADKIKDVGERRKYIQGVRDDLIDAAKKFDTGTLSAREYVDQLNLIPPSKKTQLELLADKAIQDARELVYQLAQINSKTITLTFQRHGVVDPGITGSASGGTVRGVGTSTSDSNLYALSVGEEVINARAASRNRPLLKAINATGLASGGTAGGGGSIFGLVNGASGAFALASAQDAVTRAQRDSTEAARDEAAATDEVAKARAGETAASIRLREAQEASIAQTVALGAAFGGDGTSLTAQGLLAKKRDAADDAAQFRALLGALRRKHLDPDVFAELRAQGPTDDGIALARSLVQAPLRQLRAIGRADNRLEHNAFQLAASTIGGGGTHIDRQGVVNIDKVQWGPSRRDLERGIRKAQQHALMIAGAPS